MGIYLSDVRVLKDFYVCGGSQNHDLPPSSSSSMTFYYIWHHAMHTIYSLWIWKKSEMFVRKRHVSQIVGAKRLVMFGFVSIWVSNSLFARSGIKLTPSTIHVINYGTIRKMLFATTSPKAKVNIMHNEYKLDHESTSCGISRRASDSPSSL
jgi:hypothetical protein